jgi:hypothetical protein
MRLRIMRHSIMTPNINNVLFCVAILPHYVECRYAECHYADYRYAEYCHPFTTGMYMYMHLMHMASYMGRHKLKGQNLGRVFNSRRGPSCKCRAIALITKTA